MNRWRGNWRKVSSTRRSWMPSLCRRSISRSRARCEVMPRPRTSGRLCAKRLIAGDPSLQALLRTSCQRAFHGQRADPAANLVQRLVAGQVDMDWRDRDITIANGVEIGAGTVILDLAGRTYPVHRTTTWILLLDALRR